MAGVDVLIFSKDRAAQLDLLLRSIRRHAPDLYGSIRVLWKATEPVFERGYRACVEASSGVVFWREYDFGPNVLWWVCTAGPVISFLCDDDVFYRDVEWDGWVPWSLRGGDYDYPFSVDGNVYDRDQIIQLLSGLTYTDPTGLEHMGHLHRARLPFTELPHGRPCLTGVPANRVSASSGMPHMGLHEYDLNEHYLAGERIQLPVGLGDLPAHVELVYEWEPRAVAV